MKRIIGLFILLWLAVFAGLHLTPGHGEVYLVLPRWTISVPLWLFVLAALVGYGLLRILFKILSTLFHLPSAFRHWRENAHRQHLAQYIQKGLLAFCEGQWADAEHQFSKIDTQDSLDLTSHILNAWTMQHMGNTEKRDNYLANAIQNHPKALQAILFAQLNLLLNSAQFDKKWERAWEILHQLAKEDFKHPYLCILWAEVAKKTGTINNKITSQEELLNCWQTLPKIMRKNTALQICYIKQLIHYKAEVQAEKICREHLKEEWNETLMELYGLCKLDDMDAQLRFAQSCVEKYPNQATVYLTLGRLFAQCHLWGQACDYFEQSIQINNTAQACIALAQLLEQNMQEPHKAEKYYKNAALMLASVNTSI